MPTPEELERYRQRKAERQRDPGTGLNLLKKAWQSDPVQYAVEYPRLGATEGIQKYLEAQETFEGKGRLAGMGHVGRELLESATPHVSGLKDWVDPSQETQIGGRVDLALGDFESREGRKPTLTEQYDIMKLIQDEEAPWLAERETLALTGIKPIDEALGLTRSNRMLIEGPAQGAAVALEVGLTGGTAALAKGAAGIAARNAAQSGAKAAITRGAAQTAARVLAVPSQVDRAMGSVVGSALKAPFRLTAGTARLSAASARIVANRMRKRAMDQFGETLGYSKRQADRIALGWGQRVINQGSLPQGQQLGFADLIDSRIDGGPFARLSDTELDSLIDSNRMSLWMAGEPGAAGPVQGENIFQAGREQLQKNLKDGLLEQQKRVLEMTDDEIMERLSSVERKLTGSVPVGDSDMHKSFRQGHEEYANILRGEQASRVETSAVRGNTFSIWMPETSHSPNNWMMETMLGIRDNVEVFLGTQYEKRIVQRFPRAVESVRKRLPVRRWDPATTRESKKLFRAGERSAKAWVQTEDGIRNAQEGKKTAAMALVRFNLKQLVDAGVFEFNVGSRIAKEDAERFDREWMAGLKAGQMIPARRQTASGELMSDILTGSDARGNYVLSKKILEPGETFTSRTLGNMEMGSGVLVDAKYFKGPAKRFTNPTRLEDEVIGVDLSPGFADVAERQDLYSGLLRSIDIVIEGAPVGNTYHAARHTTADALIKEIGDIAKQYEDIGVRLGVVERKAPGVHYWIDEDTGKNVGSGYFPRGPQGQVIGDETGTMLSKPEITLRQHYASEAIGQSVDPKFHRVYKSQAEGMADGQFYMAPDASVGSMVEQVLAQERNDLLGTYIKREARKHGQQFGTVDDLLWEGSGPFMQNMENMRRLITNITGRIAVAEKRIVGAQTVQGRLAKRGDEIRAGSLPSKVAEAVEAARQKLRTTVRMPGELITRLQQAPDSPLVYRDPKNVGTSFTPTFANDVDRALFVVAKGKARRAANDTEVMGWLEAAFPGVTKAAFRTAGNTVRRAVENQLTFLADQPIRNVPQDLMQQLPKGIPRGRRKTGREAAGILYPKMEIPTTTASDDLITARATRSELADAMTDLEFSFKLSPSLTPDSGDIEAIVKSELTNIQGKMAAVANAITKGESLKGAMASEKKLLEKTMQGLEAQYDELAAGVTNRMSELKGVGLEGHFFPTQFRNGIFEELRNVRPMADRSSVERAFFIANGALRMVGATGDLSAIGIQGSAVIFNDATRIALPDGKFGLGLNQTGDAFTAIKSGWGALGNDGADIVAEYFWRRHHIAVREGMPTPERWASLGLGILENAPDFYISSGQFRVPGTRRFDRSFTQMGNAFRHGIADSELKLLMVSSGKTADELIASGEAMRIATHANLITGIGKREFMGSYGQLVLFAPRFFHARMKTIGNALMGTLPGKYGRPLQRKLARQYMMRYLGSASLMTFAINDSTGHKTDINPFLFNRSIGRWMFNPNFMRIHVGELDVSLFGPWDSFLRILTVPAFLALNGLQEDEYTKGEAFKDIRRTVSGPLLSLAWDYVAGEDAMGRSTRDDYDDDGQWKFSGKRMLTTFLEHLVPFAWDEVVGSEPGRPSILSRMGGGAANLPTTGIASVDAISMGAEKMFGDEGDVSDIATGAAQVTLQGIGAKSTYESTTETLEKVFAEILELGPTDPRLRAEFGVGPANGNRMTEAEYAAWWGDKGKSWWQRLMGGIPGVEFDFGEGDFDIAVGFGGSDTDDLPPWSRVAADIQKNIKRRISEGGFSGIMTAEEMEAIEKRINERLEAGAGGYSRYAVAKKKIGDKEYQALLDRENAFIATGAKDFERYLGDVKKIRGQHARLRRNLVDPDNGQFREVVKLFEYANQTALGDTSTLDHHVFDTASSMYYDYLYTETVLPSGVRLPSIVNPADGDVDWRLRDKKMQLWHDKMKEKYPEMPDDRIARYRLRVERNARREVPPITGLVMDAQDFLANEKIGPSGETYYELMDTSIEKVAALQGVSPTKAKNLWSELNKAGNARKLAIYSENPWMRAVYNQTSADRFRLIRNHKQGEQLEGIIAMTKGEGQEGLFYIRSKHIAGILANLASGKKRVPYFSRFVADVINGESIDEYR